MKTFAKIMYPHANHLLRPRIPKQLVVQSWEKRQGVIADVHATKCSGNYPCPKTFLHGNFCRLERRKHTLVKRNYGTRTNKPLSSQHTATQFVRWLLPEERETLFIALKEFQVEEGILEQTEDNEPPPTFQQLKLVALCNAIPFIGFGLLDNAIMILAGEYIDHTIGLTLGISTMAAAAIGNLISDIMGLGLAGYVEAIATGLGFEIPPMSTRQASMWKTIYSAYFGRGIGIAIGCILGMFPLLFIDSVDEEEKEHSN